MSKRFLNGVYAVEVLNGRLNTSCPDVENNIGGYDNITFTKKINNKGYSSASSVKSSMKKFMIEQGENVSQYIKDEKKIIVEANPNNFINEDVFGFMKAETIKLNKEQYEQLDESTKKMYEGNKKETEFVNKATKKRDAKFKLNGLIGLGTSKVKKEYGICHTNGDSMPYILESYSDLMSGLFNFDIDSVGKFIISDNEKQFRDYSVLEAEALNIKDNLSKEDREHRIETTLKSLQYLSVESNQSNYLVDTTPKVVILGEYSWGNNVFQGVLNKNGINIEALKETIEDNESFRLSKIWIGISSRIASEQFNINKEELQKQLDEAELSDIIEVTTVGKAFNDYIEYMKNTLE
jgi:CRISPR-associated protein Cst2